MKRFTAENVVVRLWERDSSLWPADEHELDLIKNNLCWLDLPDTVPQYISAVVSKCRAAQGEGFDHLVFVGMGASNLAGAAVLSLYNIRSARQIQILDTTDPDWIRNLGANIPIERTLIVFASKFGKRIETHGLLLYFLEQLKLRGIASPGNHFVALTEENSYLAMLAKAYNFRNVFFDPPGISSRFSGLIHFGLFLAVVGQVEQSALAQSIMSMKDACGPATREADNPAPGLASFLVAGARQGFHRVILLGCNELVYFAYRIAQLIGNSTGGYEPGLMPFFGQANCPLEILHRNSLIVILSMKGHSEVQREQLRTLREQDLPVLEIELQNPGDLAAEIFKWEVATALACVPLGINCFQDGEGRGNLGTVSEQLEAITPKRNATTLEARVKENGISLYVEGQTRRAISGLSLKGALQTFLELRNANSYFAICPFFELLPHYLDLLRSLRVRICSTLGVPVQISSGPRYLYTLSKVYKEGPADGMFIVITSEPAEDVAIPGASYTFGDLQLSFALQEFESLGKFKKPAIRLHLLEGPEKGLKQFSDVVIQALARIRGDSD
jgi:transaldolase/glucose-6-phosphate isomerase